MRSTETFLPVFDEAHNWIDHPGFMVVAAIVAPDPADRQHIYETLVREESMNPSTASQRLSGFAQKLAGTYVTAKGEAAARTHAGHVVLELLRLQRAGVPSTLNAARRLAAYNHVAFSRKGSTPSAYRSIEKHLERLRPTLHLQPLVLCGALRLETGPELLRTLGLARAFEQLIGACAEGGSFSWSPLRVPTSVPARPQDLPATEALTDAELAAAAGR